MNTQLACRYSERRFGTSCPKTADLTKLDDRWRTAIWLGISDRSDEHIIGLETGAVLARSVRRKVKGKRCNERALKMVTGTPWNPRPGEVVVRRRYITRALIERYGRPKTAVVASGRVSNVENDAEHYYGRPMQVASTLMRWRQRTLSRRRAAKRLPKPRLSDLSSREMMKQWNRRGQKARDSKPWPVSLCVLFLPPVDEIPVSHVASHEIDERPVYDHKTGERLAPHLVKVGRRTECETSTVRTCADRVGSRQEGQMSMAGRWSRWTIRAQQARCDGSGPRNPI